MEIISYSGPQVKELSVSAFSPAPEGSALRKRNTSAGVGPEGASAPPDVPLCNTSLSGLKAQNFPATTDTSLKSVDSSSLDVPLGSFPPSGGLVFSLVVNCDTFSLQSVKQKFLRHKDKLARSPGVFLHLRKKADNSEALFHAGGTAQSRYFPEGRAYIRERLRERLGTQRRAGVFLSLTVSASDYAIQDAWALMWTRFKGLRDALNMYRKRHMGARGSLVYLAVLEQCESGYPHMHIFFPGLDWLIKDKDLYKMDEWWRMGSATTEKEHRSESAQSYVMKYLSKLEGWSDTSMALLWRFRIRLYNLSHSVYLARPKPKWEVVGQYASIEEMSKGLEISIEEAESVIDGGGRFIPLKGSERLIEERR